MSVQAVIDARLYGRWSKCLVAALDGRYGAFRVPQLPSLMHPKDRQAWNPDYFAFVEEHARDWMRMRKEAGE